MLPIIRLSQALKHSFSMQPKTYTIKVIRHFNIRNKGRGKAKVPWEKNLNIQANMGQHVDFANTLCEFCSQVKQFH